MSEGYLPWNDPWDGFGEASSMLFAQHKTSNLVFVEPKTLRIRSSSDSPFLYDYTDASPIKDRWLYVLAYSSHPVSSDGSEHLDWRLLQEYYIDTEGGYWRVDEAFLFQNGDWLGQNLKPARKRLESLAVRLMDPNAANQFAILPYFKDGVKISTATVSLAYPLPANALDVLLRLARKGHFPTATTWQEDAIENGKINPVVLDVGTIHAFSADPETGSAELCDAVSVRTLDPLEVAVRTNIVYQTYLDAYFALLEGIPDKDIFVLELANILNQNTELRKHVDGYYDSARMKASSTLTKKQMNAAIVSYKLYAEEIAQYLSSELFIGLKTCYLRNDEDSVHSPNFVHFIFRQAAAARRLQLCVEGQEFFRAMARKEGNFSADETIEDYFIPNAPPKSQAIKNVKAAIAPLLETYAALGPQVMKAQDLEILPFEILEKHVNNYLAVIGVEGAIKQVPIEDIRSWGLGYFFNLKNTTSEFSYTIITEADYKKIQDVAVLEHVAFAKINNHNTVPKQLLVKQIGISLDAIGLMLTTAEFVAKVNDGTLVWRDSVNVVVGYAAFSNVIAVQYITARYGPLGAAATLKTLAKVGATINLVGAMVSLEQVGEAIIKGEDHTAVGFGMSAAPGLVGAVYGLVLGATPPGWLVISLSICALIGTGIIVIFSRDEWQDFFKYCEVGRGGNNRQLADTPKFSPFSFAEWKGQLNVQRQALQRLLFSFEVRAIRSKDAHSNTPSIQITCRCLPVGAKFLIRWERRHGGNDGIDIAIRQVGGDAFSDSVVRLRPPISMCGLDTISCRVCVVLVPDGNIDLSSGFVPQAERGVDAVIGRVEATPRGGVAVFVTESGVFRSLKVQEELLPLVLPRALAYFRYPVKL